MNGELLEILREELQKALQKKTGWGRKEIITEFDQAAFKALAKVLDKKEKKDGN